jgi:hypothetical protein
MCLSSTAVSEACSRTPSDSSAGIPSDTVGFVFLEGEEPVQPDVEALGKYRRHAGAPGGVWPFSPEISSAMLDRYNKKPD